MTNPDTAAATTPSRRQALCGLAAALLAPGALAACSSGTSTSSAGATGSAGSGASSGGALAKLSDVPVGGGKVVDGPSGKIVLVRPTESEVKAFSAVCPHAGATVNPPSGGTITCPLHGSSFDATTGALKNGPATKGLDPENVKVQGDQIVAG